MQHALLFAYRTCRNLCTMMLDLIFPEPHAARTLRAITPDHLRDFPPATQPSFGRALWAYEHTLVREFIWQIKYYENTRLPTLAAPYLKDVLLSHLEKINTSHLPLLIVPIPLSSKRRLERGFNQAEHIAHALYTELSREEIEATYNPHLLIKKRDTPRQTTHTRAHRLHNLAHAFAVQPGRVDLKTVHVVLIDDVITTGATLTEARRECKRSGARYVTGLAIAH